MWNHATPLPLLQRSLSTCNLALSLKERLQRHSLANSHGYLHPSTIISLLQFISRPVDRILKQLGMWNCSTTGSGWNMNVDVLWNKYHTCINFIHVAGLMQVQMPTWFNGNLHRPKIDLGFGCSSPSCLELLETTKEGSMPAEQNIHYGVVFPWSRPQKSYVPMEHSKQKCLWSMYRTEILQQYIQMLHQTKGSNMFSNRWKGLFRIDVWSFSIGALDPDHAKTLGHIWHNTYTNIHTSIHIQNISIDIHIVMYIYIYR